MFDIHLSFERQKPRPLEPDHNKASIKSQFLVNDAIDDAAFILERIDENWSLESVMRQRDLVRSPFLSAYVPTRTQSLVSLEQ